MIGRSSEISFLKNSFLKGENQIVILYGREGIGKTEIIKSFCEDKAFFYYMARQVSEKEQKAMFAKEIEQKYGCVAVPVPCDAPNEYWEADNMTAKGLMSMKDAAVFCGLGSIGKSTLLLNESYGNRLTIGVILTDMELIADPIQEDLCISGCNLCVKGCPVQAIVDGKVIQKKCRLNTYGKTARGFDTVDCNKCRAVCPMRYGKK